MHTFRDLARPTPSRLPWRRAISVAVLAGLIPLVGGPSTAAAEPVGVQPPGVTGGAVVAWGNNMFGQTTVPAAAQRGVVAVAAGYRHSLALKSDGSVVAWGSDSDGQTDVPISAQSGVTAITSGGFHNLALKTDGSVVAWGRSTNGQTTVPAGAGSGVTAIASGIAHSLALKADGSVIQWGFGSVPAGASSNVIAIAAGGYHSLALKADGSVIAWGDNDKGQSTVPAAANSDVIAISAFQSHNLALKADGSVIAWGDNYLGANTVPAEAGSGVTAVASGQNSSMALKADGTMVLWGSTYDSLSTVPAGASDGVLAMAGAYSHALALVERAPTIGTDNPPTTATVGIPFGYTFAATGAPKPTFALHSGSLPPGLTLDSDSGALYGTPTTSGSYTFSLEATNGITPAASGASHTITVAAGAPTTPPAPPAPGVVRNVVAAAGESRIDVTWEAPLTGDAVAHYLVTASPGSATCTTTGLSCVLGGVAGTTYDVTVVPVSGTGANGPAVQVTSDVVQEPVVAARPPKTGPSLTTDKGKVSSIGLGKKITILGTGFLPHSTASVVIYSTPRPLGDVVTDGAGNFSTTVTVPTDIEAGDHTLVAYGVDRSGGTRTLRMAVAVQDASDEDPAGSGDTDEDSGTTADGEDTAGSAGDGLAYTGAGPVGAFVVVGSALLVAGVVFLVSARRRRTAG